MSIMTMEGHTFSSFSAIFLGDDGTPRFFRILS